MAAKRLGLGIFFTALLSLVGVLAYQWGQYGEMALSLRGISAQSMMGIIWKAVLGGSFIGWRMTGGTFSFLFPQSQKA